MVHRTDRRQDQRIDSLENVLTIAGFQALCLLSGAILFVRPLTIRSRWVSTSTTGILAAAIIVGAVGSLQALGNAYRYRESRASWRAMEVSEDLIRLLTPELNRLSISLMNPELPDHRTRDLFGPQVEVVDLEDQGSLGRGIPVDGVLGELAAWTLVEPATRDLTGNDRLWRPLLAGVEYFDSTKLSIVRGRFLDGRRDLPLSACGTKR